MLAKEKDGKRPYLYRHNKDMTLLRIEIDQIHRRFYWIYNPKDVRGFSEHVSLRLRLECHEVIIVPRCRFFFDIDLKLDEMEMGDFASAMGYPLYDGCIERIVMDTISEKLAGIYSESTKASLEEHGAVEEPDRFDWMATTRNRALENNGFKISIHLITNLMLPLEACAALADDIKTETISANAEALGIDESIISLVTEAIDPAQYRRHGSLGLPYGFKGEHQSMIIRPYALPSQSYFLQREDGFAITDADMSNYSIKAASGHITATADGDFVKQAIGALDTIPDFSYENFGVYPENMHGSTLILKRLRSSYCSVCKRNHDNDNTLQLFFGSSDGFATWKCRRKPNESKCFFRVEQSAAQLEDTDADIESFTTKLSNKTKTKPAPKPVKKAKSPAKKTKKTPVFDMVDPDEGDDPRDEEDQEVKKQKLKLKPSVQLKLKLIKAAKGLYRRQFGTGIIFKKQTEYYYTRAFNDPKAFLNLIFGRDEMYQMCSQSDHNELLHFIKNITHPDFEFLNLDYRYLGFANGVYNIKTDVFHEGDDVPKGIQVRKCFPMDFTILEDTPLLDKLLKRQFDDETIEFIYFMLGRMLYKLEDKFDFMVMLIGASGAGKSLLVNLVCHALGSDQIGILGNSFQDRFGLSEFADRQIVASDDMPRNIAKTLPKADFLSMQSRGRISCPVKGKSSIEVADWDIPTIINSNDMPNYSDTCGELVRRIAIAKFSVSLPEDEKDLNLEQMIKDTEFCTFLHRCRSKYLEYAEKHYGKNIYTFCPPHFIETRDELRGSSNESYQFAKCHIRYVEPIDGKEPEKVFNADLTKMFRNYLKEKYNYSKPPKQALDVQSIVSSDSRIKAVEENVCQSCRKKHTKGCCKDYSRTKRSKVKYIQHAVFSYQSLE